MKPWESLITVFPNLSKLKIRAFNKIRISLLSNIGNKTVIDKSDRRTIIVPVIIPISAKKKRQFFSRFPRFVPEGVDLLEEKFQKKTEDYIEKINLKDNQSTLKYFLDKIPRSDIPILKASLYLRSLFKSRDDIKDVKRDIMIRYGIRGKNISNLCSAGYFETWIKPLYEEMSKLSNFTLEKFHGAYNEVVENSPFALFVHWGMNQDKIELNIKQKIESMQKYGIRVLNIHGIGESNLKKIRKAIEHFQEIRDFEKRVEEEGNIIVVKLKKVQVQN